MRLAPSANAGGGQSRPAGVVVLAVALVGSAACLSKPPLATQTFSIDPPAPRQTDPSPAGRMLSLATVEVAPVYSGRYLVYRVGEHGIETDAYAYFAAPPGWMLRSAIAGYLRESDFVRDVVAPGEGIPVDAAVEAYASELCGDWSDPEGPASVLALRFRVVAPASSGSPPKEILLRTYVRRVRLTKVDAAAVVDGWNEALGQIMQAFLADLQPVLQDRLQPLH